MSSSFKPYVDPARKVEPKLGLKSVAEVKESVPPVSSPLPPRETERLIKKEPVLTTQDAPAAADVLRVAASNGQWSVYTTTNWLTTHNLQTSNVPQIAVSKGQWSVQTTTNWLTFHNLQTSNVPQRAEAMMPTTNEVRRGIGELMPVERTPVQRIERR